MTVLTLLTTVIVNDTTGEEVELYEYQSTKEDGTSAVLMNLYKEVLGYIPWFCNFVDSEQGREPHDFFEWTAQKFVGAIMALVYVFYMIGMAIAQLFAAIGRYIGEILMDVLTFLGPLLWLIIRAVLLILVFILIAFHLLIQIPAYLLMGASILLIATLMGGYCEFSWNFVEFSLGTGTVIRMQSDIIWIYSQFFDMNFPWVEDKIFKNGEIIMSTKDCFISGETTSEMADVDMLSMISDTQGPPELHCGYTHIEGSKYDFYTTYIDEDPPDPSYGVRLHLINPGGEALSHYQMEINPEYAGDPKYEKGVVFNYTIDLGTIYQEEGLWHYYFTTKDDSGQHDIKYMPNNAGYMLGPHISPGPQHMFSATVSNNYPDEYSNPSGFKTDNFTFLSTWLYEVVPDNVYMCLIPANKSTGIGVSKTVGIQKFSMNPIDQNANYSDFVDYYCIVNFSQLGYADYELGEFHHYYEAHYDNGNKTYIYDSESLSEDDFYNVSYCDIKAPYVGADKAQILDYSFIGTNSPLIPINRGEWWTSRAIGMISESFTRFEVIYMDPSGNPPLEGYPRLIFTNFVTGEELEPFILSEKLSTQFSREFGDDVYSYSCVISGLDLSPGAWEFRFETKDSNGVLADILYGDEKVWMMGSGMEILSGFSLTTLTAATIPIISFIIAIPWADKNPIVTGALSITSTIYSIIMLLTSFFTLANAKNTGALLGLGLGCLFSGLAILNAYKMSITKFAEFFGTFLLFGIMADVILTHLPLQLLFPEIPWEVASTVLNFIYLPVEFFLMIGSSIVCSFMMKNGLSGGKDPGSQVLKGCMRVLGVFQCIVFLMSIFAFIHLTQLDSLLQT